MLPKERESCSRPSEVDYLDDCLHEVCSTAHHHIEMVRTSNDVLRIAPLLIASSNDRIVGRPHQCEDCRVSLDVFSDGPFGTIYRCAGCHAVVMEPSKKSRS